MSSIFPLRELKRVYCAGPLFNETERREMIRIGDVLKRAGFEPFVPHADGMEFADVQPFLVAEGYDAVAAGRVLHEAIFALDVYQVVVGCGSLVLNMNGRVPDEGAVAEAAMAWTLGKPLVVFKDDARSNIAGRDNPLLAGLAGFKTVTSAEAVGRALRARHAELSPNPAWEIPCPPQLEPTLTAGSRLWGRLQALGDVRPAAPVAEVVLALFGAPAASRDGLPRGGGNHFPETL